MKRRNEIVYIKYWDHVLFKNLDPEQLQPSMRECVGWIHKENDKAVWLIWERPVKALAHERPDPNVSGLIVLKHDIIEIRRLKG